MILFTIVSTLLICIPLILAVISRWLPGTRLHWLMISFLSITSWIMLIVSLTFAAGSNLWEYNVLLPDPSLAVKITWDPVSWSFGVTCAALLLSSTLTSVHRLSSENPLEKHRPTWLITSFFTGLGLISIASANLNTVILTWAAFDFSRISIFFLNKSDNNKIRREAAAFGLNCVSLLILIYASWQSQNLDLSLPNDPQGTLVYGLILAAAGLRVFGLPLIISYREDQPEWNHIKTFLTFISTASGLILISRIANATATENTWSGLIILLGLAGLLSGIYWLNSTRSNFALSPWIFGLSTFAVAGSIFNLPFSSQAWGIALLLCGGLLSNYQIDQRRALPVLLFGMIGLTALAFTPAWQGVLIFGNAGSIAIRIGQGMLLLALANYLGGYSRHIFYKTTGEWRVGNRIWILYISGLAFLPLTQWVILIWGIPGLSNNLQAFPSIQESWPAFIAITIGIAFSWLINRIQTRRAYDDQHTRLLNLEWLVNFFKNIFVALTNLVGFLDRLFEGEGGLLWTMLFLILLVGFLFQLGMGG